LWRQAGKRGRLPTEAELERARAASRWELIALTPTGAIKQAAGAGVDLGGIAKGYGIDRAVAALRGAGAIGGLVDVGGDLRCFGEAPHGQAWTVQVKDPFGGDPLGELRLRDAAVCTSGNYARFTEIEGRRYSHIVDPRSGVPADAVPSATVAAPTALSADIWATALSVLGRDGLARLPQGVEALLVVGSKEDFRVFCTAGFRDLMKAPLPQGLTVASRTRQDD
jgi:thiamine biosynthesis lipoprotein